MRYDIPTTATTVGQITQSVNQCLGRLLQKRQLDESAQDDFAAVRSLLEAMPLSTDQFGLASTRLQNAQHHLTFVEPGGAYSGSGRVPPRLRARTPIGPKFPARRH